MILKEDGEYASLRRDCQTHLFSMRMRFQDLSQISYEDGYESSHQFGFEATAETILTLLYRCTECYTDSVAERPNGIQHRRRFGHHPFIDLSDERDCQEKMKIMALCCTISEAYPDCNTRR